MSTRKETERAKLIQDKCQTLLTQMLRDEDNKYCVDCDAKGPRWASWNLGVFLCIRCAGIHRNLGVHISRVKSVNLDSWTPEQVVSLQQMGNSRARAVYEAQLPDGFRRPQTDSALESFIRAKYEHKKYLAREWVPPPPPKVDWAKEIDEEIERQKRKKKSTQSGSSISGISSAMSGGDSTRKSGSSGAAKTATIPAPLPKPKSSSSPKTNRTDNSHHHHHHQQQQQHHHQNNSDLLGLSSPVNSCESSKKSNDCGGADGFSSFLSAPVSDSSKANENKDSGINSLAKEEEDFFKQSGIGTTDKDKGKLTKDSILALYGTAPNNSIGQFNNNPLVGFNSTFTHQPGAVGQFMQIPVVPSQTPFATAGGAVHHMPPVSGIPTAVGASPYGAVTAAALTSNHLNLNLAGMPPGLLGPPQPQPQNQQFMSTPSSVTSMYNAPVMTAPGAFTSAMPQQQILPQPTFAQFPPQVFGGGGAATMSGGGIPATGFNTATMPGSGIGGIGMGGGMSTMGAVPIPTASATTQPTSNNLSQQFGNLNLGNVWQ